MSANQGPSRLRRLWIRWRYNGCCPCSHDHGVSVTTCAFCYWCQQDAKGS